MSKFIIIAAAAPVLLFAAPAFAQSAPPSTPLTTQAPEPSTVNLGSLGKVDAAGQPRHPAFNGPHGSASDLTDRPPSDPTAARGHVKVFDGATGGPLRTAQTATGRPGFDGPHGSATNLRDAPSSDPTAARNPAFNGPHGSASDLTDRPPSDPTAVRGQYRQLLGRDPGSTATNGHVKVFSGATGSELSSAPVRTGRPGFNGPHGSATNLTDAPTGDPTAGVIKRATLYGRKAGDDKRQDYGRPAPRPTGGVTTVSAGGTLQTTGAARMQSQNNLKQMGTANAPR